MEIDKAEVSLPVELVPLILSHLSHSLSTLCNTSLVNRLFLDQSRPILYDRLWLRSQARVTLLFRTLGSSPSLCSLVKVLEVRVYPLGLRAEALEQLEEQVGNSLSWMDNLVELYWTRTGSLNDRIVDQMVQGKRKLKVLELTGNTRYYDIRRIGGSQTTRRREATLPSSSIATSHSDDKGKGDVDFPFPSLQDFSLLLPTEEAIRHLLEVSNRVRLRSISLLCQHTSVFQPAHAAVLADRCADLERLVLVGCKRVDGDSMTKMIKGSRRGIKALSVEGCSVVSTTTAQLLKLPFVDAERPLLRSLAWQHPSFFPAYSPSLTATLTTLTLTLPRPSFCSHSDFYLHLGQLVSQLDHLSQFTLYAPSGVKGDEAVEDRDFLGEEEQIIADPLPATQDEGTTALQSTTTTTSSATVPKLPLSFLRKLLLDPITTAPHRRLKLLRVHGIACSLEGLRIIGESCGPDPSKQVSDDSAQEGCQIGLHDLVLQLESGPLVTLLDSLSPLAPSLQKLHLLSRIGGGMILHEEDLRWLSWKLVNPSQPAHTGPRSSGALKQIGFRNRVWEVHRALLPISEAEGADQVSVELRRWNASEGRWPEALLVVKA